MSENRMKIGSLKCRGMKTQTNIMQMADDMMAYKLSVMAVQETHLVDSEAEII